MKSETFGITRGQGRSRAELRAGKPSGPWKPLALALWALGVVAFQGCRSEAPRGVVVPSTTPASTSPASRPWATASDLAEGRRLHDQKCGACHIQYARESRSPQEWESVMRRMGPKAGLDTLSQRLVLDWLILGDAPGP